MTPAPALRERGLKVVGKLPTIASVIILILIAYTAAQVTWRLLAPAPVSISRPMNAPKQPNDINPKKHKNNWQIAQLHLFGKAEAPKKETVVKAPETRLNLTLKGIYASGGENAYAIISSNNSDERFYRLGDSIADGTSLNAVYPDRVILERDQQFETLSLPKGKDAGIEFAPSKESQNTNAAPPPSAQGAEIRKIRDRILKNPTQLSKMVQAMPVRKDGQFLGYRLSPRQNAQLFHKIGLKAGDVVTTVNGIAIDRPEKGLSALQSLVDAGDVTLTLIRDGNEMTLHQSLNQ